MRMASATLSLGKSQAERAIWWAGLIAGTLDLTAAFVSAGLRGRGPVQILHSIASGLLGAASFRGGFATAALGAALHFVIAFGAAAVYYAASRQIKLLVRQAVVCGLIYGVAVYAFMNLVVLPLSAISFKPAYPPAALVTGLIIHMLCVGLPIALVVRRFSHRF